MRKYTLVCAGMAGTTVTDDGLVEQAAAVALADSGLPAATPAHGKAMTQVRQTMGQSTTEVFRAVLGSERAARAAGARFDSHMADHIRQGAVTPLPAAADTLEHLRSEGVKVVLTTGFSKPTQDAIIAALAWRDLVDMTVCPGLGLRGRPLPDMILHAVLQLGIDDVRRVAVIGDSVHDVYCGLRAGASLVAGVTSGAHDANALREAGATCVLDGIKQLPDVLTR